MEETVTKQRKVNTGIRIAALSAMASVGLWSAGASAQDAVSFKDDVFPIIELRCLECHQPGGSGYEANGLDMRTHASLMKGTKFGDIVSPGRIAESNLLAVLERRTDPALFMPHGARPVSKCEKLLFRFWVAQGAPDN